MAKVSDWEVPREFGLGNELGRYIVKGYSMVGQEMAKEEFTLEVTAFSANQAEMRFRYLYGDGIHKITEIVRVGDVGAASMADATGGREKRTHLTKPE